MKALLLSVCLATALIAEEPSEIAMESIEIDPLIAVKEQFSKARKKGWDFSAEKSKSELAKKSESFPIEFVLTPDNNNPAMHKSEQLMKYSSRKDISEVERGKQMARINEMDHPHRHPGKRNNSR